MISERLPSILFKKNRSKLMERFPQGAVAVFCSNHKMPRNGDQYFPYRQNSDFFYLTGITQEKSMLLLISGHPDKMKREILFIIKPTHELELWHGKKLTKKKASDYSGIQTVEWLDEFDMYLNYVIKSAEIIFFNIPEYTRFKPDVKSCDQQMASMIREKYPDLPIGQSAPLLTRLRMFKEPEEIEVMKEACLITERVFLKILRSVRPGIMEYEIEAEITYHLQKSGVPRHAFEPIVASGKNALVLHYITNKDKCRPGELVLIDFGAEYLNYASDCSRTIPVNGSYTKRQREIYNAVLKVLNESVKLMIPGKPFNQLQSEVGLLWQEEHLKLGLYNRADLNSQNPGDPKWNEYFIHGISHSIGLDVHDPLDREQKISAGMVLSCEPAIYIPEEMTGIRLENEILITENGPVNLMSRIPITPDEIENIMKQQ